MDQARQRDVETTHAGTRPIPVEARLAPVPGLRRAPGQGETRRLLQGDRLVVALLGLCRYLSVGQVVALAVAGRTDKGVAQRFRRLAGEGRRQGCSPPPALVRPLPYRSYTGEPMRLWGLTSAGTALASVELGRELHPLRTEVGAFFAEHFVSLTDLFVQLVHPFLNAGLLPRTLPFRWNVTEDVELPWKDSDEGGATKPRVIRPDAVLEVPSAQRRFFIECETGSHTLTPRSPDKPQATVRKLERYDAYVSGLADVPGRLSHYQKKYPDGWRCEVLFLVPSEGRQRATEAALAAALETLAGTRLTAHAFTLQQAAAHCAAHLPLPAGAPQRLVQPSFYGEAEHGAVRDYVLEMTAALAEANTRLLRHGLHAVPGPISKAGMLDFLRKAQVEMQRLRRTAPPSHA